MILYMGSVSFFNLPKATVSNLDIDSLYNIDKQGEYVFGNVHISVSVYNEKIHYEISYVDGEMVTLIRDIGETDSNNFVLLGHDRTELPKPVTTRRERTSSTEVVKAIATIPKDQFPIALSYSLFINDKIVATTNIALDADGKPPATVEIDYNTAHHKTGEVIRVGLIPCLERDGKRRGIVFNSAEHVVSIAPSPPIAMTVTAVTGTTALVQFTNPNGAAGSRSHAINKLVVENQTNKSEPKLVFDGNMPDSKFTLNHLKNGDVYEYRLWYTSDIDEKGVPPHYSTLRFTFHSAVASPESVLMTYNTSHEQQKYNILLTWTHGVAATGLENSRTGYTIRFREENKVAWEYAQGFIDKNDTHRVVSMSIVGNFEFEIQAMGNGSISNSAWISAINKDDNSKFIEVVGDAKGIETDTLKVIPHINSSKKLQLNVSFDIHEETRKEIVKIIVNVHWKGKQYTVPIEKKKGTNKFQWDNGSEKEYPQGRFNIELESMAVAGAFVPGNLYFEFLVYGNIGHSKTVSEDYHLYGEELQTNPVTALINIDNDTKVGSEIQSMYSFIFYTNEDDVETVQTKKYLKIPINNVILSGLEISNKSGHTIFIGNELEDYKVKNTRENVSIINSKKHRIEFNFEKEYVIPNNIEVSDIDSIKCNLHTTYFGMLPDSNSEKDVRDYVKEQQGLTGYTDDTFEVDDFNKIDVLQKAKTDIQVSEKSVYDWILGADDEDVEKHILRARQSELKLLSETLSSTYTGYVYVLDKDKKILAKLLAIDDGRNTASNIGNKSDFTGYPAFVYVQTRASVANGIVKLELQRGQSVNGLLEKLKAMKVKDAYRLLFGTYAYDATKKMFENTVSNDTWKVGDKGFSIFGIQGQDVVSIDGSVDGEFELGNDNKWENDVRISIKDGEVVYGIYGDYKADVTLSDGEDTAGFDRLIVNTREALAKGWMRFNGYGDRSQRRAYNDLHNFDVTLENGTTTREVSLTFSRGDGKKSDGSSERTGKVSIIQHQSTREMSVGDYSIFDVIEEYNKTLTGKPDDDIPTTKMSYDKTKKAFVIEYKAPKNREVKYTWLTRNHSDTEHNIVEEVFVLAQNPHLLRQLYKSDGSTPHDTIHGQTGNTENTGSIDTTEERDKSFSIFYKPVGITLGNRVHIDYVMYEKGSRELIESDPNNDEQYIPHFVPMKHEIQEAVQGQTDDVYGQASSQREYPIPMSVAQKQYLTALHLGKEVEHGAPSQAIDKSLQRKFIEHASGTYYTDKQKEGQSGERNPANTARFDTPSNIVITKDGVMYVSDSQKNHIRKVDIDGTVSTIAGSTRGYKDGIGREAQFTFPNGITLDAHENLYVCDTNNNRIRKVDTKTGMVSTISSTFTFNLPYDIVVDSAGNLFVADTGSNRIIIIVANSAATIVWAGTGAQGDVNATRLLSQFNQPQGIAIDDNSNIYISDTGNNKIKVLNDYTESVSDFSVTGVTLSKPRGIAIHKDNVFIANSGENNIILHNIETNGSSIIAGKADGSEGDKDGTKSQSMLHAPIGMAFSPGKVYLYIADSDNHKIKRMLLDSAQRPVKTIAGTIKGEIGDIDGDSLYRYITKARKDEEKYSGAEFEVSYGMTRDDDGNLYVCDSHNHRIRKIEADGKVTTLAGSGQAGYKDGIGEAAQFHTPFGIVYGVRRNELYVSDAENNRIRRIVLNTGMVETIAGTGERGSADNAYGMRATFNIPLGIALNTSAEFLHVLDGNTLIRKVNVEVDNFRVVTEYGSTASGDVNATGLNARFNGLTGITVDQHGNLFVSDTGNKKIKRIVYQTDQVSTVWSNLPSPMGIQLDSGNTKLYVVDSIDHSVKMITLNANGIGTAITPLSSSTKGFLNGTFTVAKFDTPYDLVIGKDENDIYVMDTLNYKVRKVELDASVVSTFVGTKRGYANSTLHDLQIGDPYGIVADDNGNVYFSDDTEHIIRKVTPAGVVETIAGREGIQGDKDGTGTNAEFRNPEGITLDDTNNLYVCDYSNHKIRKIDLTTLEVTTYAGTGTSGLVEGRREQAQFDRPIAIIYHKAFKELFICDRLNYRIRRISTSGVVSTYAGNGTKGDKDGNLLSAQLSHVMGITCVNDRDGIFYIVDADGSSVSKIKKIDSNLGNPQVVTYAGGANGDKDGTALEAKFNYPKGITAGANKELYVCDTNNNRIRKIDTNTDTVSTIAGSTRGYKDGIGSEAEFDDNIDISYKNAKLYVTDRGNDAIRVIDTNSVTYDVSTLIKADAIGTHVNPDEIGRDLQHAAELLGMYIVPYLSVTKENIGDALRIFSSPTIGKDDALLYGELLKAIERNTDNSNFDDNISEVISEFSSKLKLLAACYPYNDANYETAIEVTRDYIGRGVEFGMVFLGTLFSIPWLVVDVEVDGKKVCHTYPIVSFDNQDSTVDAKSIFFCRETFDLSVDTMHKYGIGERSIAIKGDKQSHEVYNALVSSAYHWGEDVVTSTNGAKGGDVIFENPESIQQFGFCAMGARGLSFDSDDAIQYARAVRMEKKNEDNNFQLHLLKNNDGQYAVAVRSILLDADVAFSHVVDENTDNVSYSNAMETPVTGDKDIDVVVGNSNNTFRNGIFFYNNERTVFGKLEAVEGKKGISYVHKDAIKLDGSILAKKEDLGKFNFTQGSNRFSKQIEISTTVDTDTARALAGLGKTAEPSDGVLRFSENVTQVFQFETGMLVRTETGKIFVWGLWRCLDGKGFIDALEDVKTEDYKFSQNRTEVYIFKPQHIFKGTTFKSIPTSMTNFANVYMPFVPLISDSDSLYIIPNWGGGYANISSDRWRNVRDLSLPRKPQKFSSTQKFTSVTMSEFGMLAVTKAGKLVAKGKNVNYALGIEKTSSNRDAKDVRFGYTSNNSQANPGSLVTEDVVDVNADTDWKEVSFMMGGMFAIAVKTNGDVYVFGKMARNTALPNQKIFSVLDIVKKPTKVFSLGSSYKMIASVGIVMFTDGTKNWKIFGMQDATLPDVNQHKGYYYLLPSTIDDYGVYNARFLNGLASVPINMYEYDTRNLDIKSQYITPNNSQNSFDDCRAIDAYVAVVDPNHSGKDVDITERDEIDVILFAQHGDNQVQISIGERWREKTRGSERNTLANIGSSALLWKQTLSSTISYFSKEVVFMQDGSFRIYKIYKDPQKDSVSKFVKIGRATGDSTEGVAGRKYVNWIDGKSSHAIDVQQMVVLHSIHKAHDSAYSSTEGARTVTLNADGSIAMFKGELHGSLDNAQPIFHDRNFDKLIEQQNSFVSDITVYHSQTMDALLISRTDGTIRIYTFDFDWNIVEIRDCYVGGVIKKIMTVQYQNAPLNNGVSVLHQTNRRKNRNIECIIARDVHVGDTPVTDVCGVFLDYVYHDRFNSDEERVADVLPKLFYKKATVPVVQTNGNSYYKNKERSLRVWNANPKLSTNTTTPYISLLNTEKKVTGVALRLCTAQEFSM